MNEQIPPRVLEILEWPVIQEELRRRCKTPTGELLAGNINPLDTTGVRARMRKISHLKEIIHQKESPDFSGITDIEPLCAQAVKGGILKLEDCAVIRQFIMASARIMRFLKENKDEFPGISDENGAMDRLTDIGTILAASITENNELNDATYPDLRRIKSELFMVKQEIEKILGTEMRSPAVEPALQEKIITTRNDRYVILVKSSLKEKVRGTVHDISASGATCYIEPREITPLNNKALMLEKELQAEIFRILRVLSAAVSENAGPLLGHLRVISGLA